MKKILFINFGGIGDEILFLPVIQGLKKSFPDSKSAQSPPAKASHPPQRASVRFSCAASAAGGQSRKAAWPAVRRSRRN